MSVLRSIEHIPRERWSVANIAYWLPLRPDATVEEVRAALELLPVRHESLRTRYHLPAAGTPAQWVEERAEDFVGLAEIDGTDEARDALVDAGRESSFGLEDDFGWRAVIATTDGRPRGLAVSVHHIAADDWGQGLITRDLSAVLAAAEPGPPATGEDQLSGPAALAVEQRSTAWRERRQQARRFHGDILRSGLLVPNPLAPGEQLTELPPRYDGVLRLDHLAGPLRTVARDAGLLPQALLLAASTLTAAVCFGELSTAWWMTTSNRFDPRWSGLVTSMNQVVPMRADLATDAALTDLARTLQTDSFGALRYGCYDVDEVNNLSQEIIGGLPLWQYMFNHSMGAGGLTGPADDRPLDEVPYAEPTTAVRHRSTPATCYFTIVDDPHLALNYYTTRPGADEQQVTTLLHTYETLLRALLTDPGQKVRPLIDGVREAAVR